MTDAIPHPFHEAIGATLRRALVIGAALATVVALTLPAQRHPLIVWLTVFPAILWFPLGGHYVELLYLNVLRMKSAWARRHPFVSRPAVWFLGGLPLGVGCRWTWVEWGNDWPIDVPIWWGMPFFVIVECVVHGFLSLLGRPSFWNGRD